MLLQALNKLEKEVREFKGGTKEQVVYRPVADALKSFCRQDAEFAQAIAQSTKTLSDCCKTIMTNVGGSISDIDTYRKAVQFYFPGADVEVHMAVDLNPAGGDADAPESGAGKVINLSFDDFLD